MQTIFVLVALISVLASPARGDPMESLVDVVNKSMTAINEYRDDYVTGFNENLVALESEAARDINEESGAVYKLVEDKLAEADEKGIDARKCAETLLSDMNTVEASAYSQFRACVDNVISFTRKFAPFISNQGNTGYVMLEGLGITAKNLAKVSANEASQCYEHFEWYTSAVSWNYDRSSDTVRGACDYLQNFLRGNVLMCFQRPAALAKRELEAIGERVVACIDEQMNQH